MATSRDVSSETWCQYVTVCHSHIYHISYIESYIIVSYIIYIYIYHISYNHISYIRFIYDIFLLPMLSIETHSRSQHRLEWCWNGFSFRDSRDSY